MRAAILGGGPGGLYFAISLKLRDPAHEVVVIERNRPDDTFGWGVVLSADTLDNLDANDPESAAAIRGSFAYWDDIAVHYRGTVTRSGGHGFSGIGRRRLLNILQDRARELGVDIRFETEAQDLEAYKDFDLIVGADGVNSRVRAAHADVFKPDIDVRACKYIWLGTHQKFDDAFTFIFEETEHGWIWAHAYQFDADTATFIVECSEATWRQAGFDRMDGAQTIAACEKIFARYLNGNALMSNAKHLRGSAWLNFNRVLCERWSTGNVVLLGDAAATAHFSVGSGSKLAMESAIALANYLHSEPTHGRGFRPLRGRAAAGSAALAERRAQFDRMVRGRRALSASRSGAVQLFAAHPLAAHQPREPAPARSGLARRRREVVRDQGDRRDPQRGAPADVRAVARARRRIEEPRGGLADGRNTAPSTARRTTGISCITPSAPRAAPASCSPR